MKQIILLFLLFILPFISHGQDQKELKKNTFSVGLGQKHFFNVLSESRISFAIPEISYAHKLNKNIGIRGSFSFWRPTNAQPQQQAIELTSRLDSNSVGKRIEKSKFKYFDIEAVGYYSIGIQHQISFSIGPSLLSSLDTYVDCLSLIYYNEPWGIRPHLISSGYTSKMEIWAGAIMGVDYSYSFWKEKLILSLNFKGRIYNQTPFHIVYGIHIGYNF